MLWRGRGWCAEHRQRCFATQASWILHLVLYYCVCIAFLSLQSKSSPVTKFGRSTVLLSCCTLSSLSHRGALCSYTTDPSLCLWGRVLTWWVKVTLHHRVPSPPCESSHPDPVCSRLWARRSLWHHRCDIVSLSWATRWTQREPESMTKVIKRL